MDGPPGANFIQILCRSIAGEEISTFHNFWKRPESGGTSWNWRKQMSVWRMKPEQDEESPLLVFPPENQCNSHTPTLDIHQLRLEHRQPLENLWNKSKDAMLQINQKIFGFFFKQKKKKRRSEAENDENKHRNVPAVCAFKFVKQTGSHLKPTQGVSAASAALCHPLISSRSSRTLTMATSVPSSQLIVLRQSRPLQAANSSFY